MTGRLGTTLKVLQKTDKRGRKKEPQKQVGIINEEETPQEIEILKLFMDKATSQALKEKDNKSRAGEDDTGENSTKLSSSRLNASGISDSKDDTLNDSKNSGSQSMSQIKEKNYDTKHIMQKVHDEEFMLYTFESAIREFYNLTEIVKELDTITTNQKKQLAKMRHYFFYRILDEPFNVAANLRKFDNYRPTDDGPESKVDPIMFKHYPPEIYGNYKEYCDLFTGFHLHPCMILSILRYSLKSDSIIFLTPLEYRE